MSKRMYIIPETETAPLHLSACIMSGGGGQENPNLAPTDNVQPGHFEAPHRRVY